MSISKSSNEFLKNRCKFRDPHGSIEPSEFLRITGIDYHDLEFAVGHDSFSEIYVQMDVYETCIIARIKNTEKQIAVWNYMLKPMLRAGFVFQSMVLEGDIPVVHFVGRGIRQLEQQKTQTDKP